MKAKRIASALDTQIGGSHYKETKIQPVEYIVANDIAFLPGNVIKRMTRFNKPTGKGKEDLEKAIHEIQLLLELTDWDAFVAMTFTETNNENA